MSKNIVIQEGGTGKQLTVDKLKTNIVGGGTCLWVPEDTTRLGTKHISENGTYRASDDGCYGYSEVTVSGIGSVTGKDPDGSGDEATATVDPETGEITVEKIPSYISVITPPSKTTYLDGETIDVPDSMVVKAYLKSGGEYGVVPNGELVFPVTIAQMGSSEQKASSDLFCGIVQPFAFGSTVSLKTITQGAGTRTENHYEATLTGAAFAVGYNEGSGFFYIPAAASPGQSTYTSVRVHTSPDYDGPPDVPTVMLREFSNEYTYNGKTVYFGRFSLSGFSVDTISPVSSILIDSMTQYAGQIAWTMIYGDISSGGTQEIPVQWSRPGNGAILETSFDIQVTPAV